MSAQASQKEPSWLAQLRLSSKKNYEKAVQPKLIYGLGIFNPLEGFDWKALGEDSTNEITAPKSTEKGLIVCTLAEALKNYPKLMEKYFLRIIDSQEDKFTLSHAALVKEGIVVIAQKNAKISKPLSLQFSSTGEIERSHLLIIVEEGAEVTVEEANTGSAKFQSKVVEGIVGKNAVLQFLSIQNAAAFTQNISRKHIQVETHGKLTWLECALGSQLTKANTVATLNGPEASVLFQSGFFSNQKQQFDHHALIVHNARNTKSEVIARGALDDASKVIFRGRVKIQPHMSHCAGKQHEDTLLLSSDAEADVVPDLEIDNNEVQCAHSATISSLSEEKLFYLNAKGLDVKTAKTMLTFAFFEPFIAKVKDKKIHDILESSIRGKLR